MVHKTPRFYWPVAYPYHKVIKLVFVIFVYYSFITQLEAVLLTEHVHQKVCIMSFIWHEIRMTVSPLTIRLLFWKWNPLTSRTFWLHQESLTHLKKRTVFSFAEMQYVHINVWNGKRWWQMRCPLHSLASPTKTGTWERGLNWAEHIHTQTQTDSHSSIKS